MLPMLPPLNLPAPANGLANAPGDALPTTAEDVQAIDLEEISGSFEATLAGLDEAVPAGLAALAAQGAALAGQVGAGGRGLPGGGRTLPPGTAAGLPGIPTAAADPAALRGWQPGELVALLASERGLAMPGATRAETPGLLGLTAGVAPELPTAPGGQAQSLLARLDGLLTPELAAGGAGVRSPGLAAGGPGTATAGLLAGQSPLVPDSPGFGRQLGQRLIMMAQQGLQQAQIRIHPEHLGPMDVRLRMEGEAVQLSLASPHASVREALESALPRLRDTLAEHGLSLADAQVGGGEQQSAGRGEGDEEPGQGAPGGGSAAGRADSEADAEGDGRLTPLAVSLVDTFA